MTEALIPAESIAMCRQTIETHSKSFSLASKLLAPSARDDAAVLYAWCRYADDAIDESPLEEQAGELERLKSELDAIYAGTPQTEPVLAAFQVLVRRCEIPKQYPSELLEGMAMDVEGQRYPDMAVLLQYCYRVASTVGLMMSHVVGLSRDDAMSQAAHLGIAMQLTNICRDVLEDWERKRLYLPDDLLARHGADDLRLHLGDRFPAEYLGAVAGAVRELLETADVYYRSGDAGMPALPWRAAFGVRTARLVYSDIGREIQKQDFDVSRGRAFVSASRKIFLVCRSAATSVFELPIRWLRFFGRGLRHTTPKKRIEFSHDLLCH